MDAARDYPNLGIYSFGRGLFRKPPIPGATTSARTLFRVRRGQFIYSRLFAFEGAYGLVSQEFDGSFVSNEFPMFEPDTARLLPEYLASYLRIPSVWDKVAKTAVGMGDRRRRVQPQQLLRHDIPLPPLSEQRRIIVMLDQVSAKVAAARGLRKELASCTDLLMAAEERRLWPLNSLENAPTLAEVTRFLARGRQSEQGHSDHVLIKTQHVQQGRYVPSLVRLAPHVAQKVHTDAIAQEGDILVACSAAGCLGRVARYEGDGRHASTDTHVAIVRANPDVIDPDYLYAYLRGAQGQHELRSRERGDWRREKIGFRLTELNLKDLKSVPVPLPSRLDQRRVVQELSTLRRGTDSLKHLQDQTSAQLEALIPAILDRAFNGEL